VAVGPDGHPTLDTPHIVGGAPSADTPNRHPPMSGHTSVLGAAAGAGPMRTGVEVDLQPVLDALGDPDCRGLLRTIDDDALTALECSEAYDLPLSTTYRKLERLAEADLVAEEIRLRADGKHASEYRRIFDAVCIGVAEGGEFELSVTPADA